MKKQMKKLESNNSLVVRANKLVEAKYRLTATEQKIIHIITAMIHKDDEDFRPYTLRISDLIALLETDSHNKYAQVKEVTRNMMKKVFTIHDIEQKREIQVAWFSSVDYQYGKGMVTFEFSPYLKPLMLQLKSHFTKLNLENVMQLRSGYSLRLYELLKQYESIGKRQFQLMEFRELLGIPKNEYPLYANFKQRVLLQAHEEINARTDIMFDFEEVKEGKKAVALIFSIRPKRKAIIAEPQKQPNDITTNQTGIEAVQAEFQRLYGGKLVDKFVAQMLSEKGLEHVQECLQMYKDYIQGQEIRNLGGHFREFVMSGYQKPVPHNGKDTITAPKYEKFIATDEERREVEESYTVAGRRSYEKVGKVELKSINEILTGRIKIPETK
jgi:plasmid replication initiation protein